MVYSAASSRRRSAGTAAARAVTFPRIVVSGSSGEMVTSRVPDEPVTQGASSSADPRNWLIMAVTAASLVSQDPALAHPMLAPLLGNRIAAGDQVVTSRRSPVGWLTREIDAEPVEDGVTHPAEPALGEFLARYGAGRLYRELFESGLGNGRIADLLRLLGRIQVRRAEEFEPILRTALASPSLDVRDAAVHVIELWENPRASELLRTHHEPLPWLADHIARVLRGLA